MGMTVPLIPGFAGTKALSILYTAYSFDTMLFFHRCPQPLARMACAQNKTLNRERTSGNCRGMEPNKIEGTKLECI